MEVITMNPEYPCCGRRARFSENDTGQNKLVRMCPSCGTRWSIQRTTIETDEVHGRRLDSVGWTPMIGG